MYTGFDDGVKLIVLLQQLTGEIVCKKYNKKPKLQLHKLENLNRALDFIKANGIKLVNIGSADIHGHNETIILGLVWRLIEYYQVFYL